MSCPGWEGMHPWPPCTPGSINQAVTHPVTLLASQCAGGHCPFPLLLLPPSGLGRGKGRELFLLCNKRGSHCSKPSARSRLALPHGPARLCCQPGVPWCPVAAAITYLSSGKPRKTLRHLPSVQPVCTIPSPGIKSERARAESAPDAPEPPQASRGSPRAPGHRRL